ncbi:MAG: hypothetical protein R3E77_11145 [Steroidobacteraceae bacterium]
MSAASVSPPAVGAVVIPLIGEGNLQGCLDDLRRLNIDYVIVGNKGSHALSAEQHAHWIESDAPVPLRRQLGVASITTDWILIIEDSARLCGNWRAILESLDGFSRVDAIAGPIRLARTLNGRDIALACLEYGEFALPANGHAINRLRLPGLCIAYRRTALTSLPTSQGIQEPIAQASILANHRGLLDHPDAEVEYSAVPPGAATWANRYAHGTIFAASVHQQRSLGRRLLSVFGAPLIATVLAARAIRAWRRCGHGRRTALPWIVVFACAWACGEAVGSMRPASARLASWR